MIGQVNPHAAQWRHFLKNTAEHQLTILHEDGLYRHLRMNKPGSYMWGWDIVTWPGRLAIYGDIGRAGMFARIDDMISFFDVRHYPKLGDGSPFINPSYWGEKFSMDCMVYSPDVFLAEVRQTLEDAEDRDQLDIEDIVSSAMYSSDSECEAVDWLRLHEDVLGSDIWEMRLKDYDYHFILGLYAIVTTVDAYRNS